MLVLSIRLNFRETFVSLVNIGRRRGPCIELCAGVQGAGDERRCIGQLLSG